MNDPPSSLAIWMWDWRCRTYQSAFSSTAFGTPGTYTKGRLVTSSLNGKQLNKDGWDNSHQMAK